MFLHAKLYSKKVDISKSRKDKIFKFSPLAKNQHKLPKIFSFNPIYFTKKERKDGLWHEKTKKLKFAYLPYILCKFYGLSKKLAC